MSTINGQITLPVRLSVLREVADHHETHGPPSRRLVLLWALARALTAYALVAIFGEGRRTGRCRVGSMAWLRLVAYDWRAMDRRGESPVPYNVVTFSAEMLLRQRELDGPVAYVGVLYETLRIAVIEAEEMALEIEAQRSLITNLAKGVVPASHA